MPEAYSGGEDLVADYFAYLERYGKGIAFSSRVEADLYRLSVTSLKDRLERSHNGSVPPEGLGKIVDSVLETGQGIWTEGDGVIVAATGNFLKEHTKNGSKPVKSAPQVLLDNAA